MVTKRKSARRAAPRRRIYAARRAAPRRRTKSGVTMIPSAMASAALIAVNVKPVKDVLFSVTNQYKAGPAEALSRLGDGLTGKNSWISGNMKKLISVNQLVTDAAAVAGGYVAGEVVKKYAPGVIKRPLGKIAKKVPKVI